MLLKTNKRREDGVLLAGYIIEKKMLRGITRQVKSILMNIQEITEKSTADEQQITYFSSAKCEKCDLNTNLVAGRQPCVSAMPAGHSIPGPHLREYTLLRHPLLQPCGWCSPLFLCIRHSQVM
jgi:hypothetical protein